MLICTILQCPGMAGSPSINGRSHRLHRALQQLHALGPFATPEGPYFNRDAPLTFPYRTRTLRMMCCALWSAVCTLLTKSVRTDASEPRPEKQRILEANEICTHTCMLCRVTSFTFCRLCLDLVCFNLLQFCMARRLPPPTGFSHKSHVHTIC